MEIKKIVIKVVSIVVILFFGGKNIVAEEEFHAIVAQDGSGDYTSISHAVEAAPNYSPTRLNIKIKAGVYKEHVTVEQHKQNLALIGEGADVTIITNNRSNKNGYGTTFSATVDVKGINFIGKYITFKNSAGPEAGPALALKVSANYTTFYKCKIDGYQDTLFVDSGYQFFRESIISGTDDFIFGSAPVVFQNCDIIVHNRPGGVTVLTAQSKDNSTIGKSAMSFHNCSIKTAPDFDPDLSLSTFLGRTYKDHATVVFIESFLDEIIDPLGWSTMIPGERPSDLIFYGEYNNYGPGAGMEKRVGWARPGKLDGEQADGFTVRNLIDGNDWLPSIEIPYRLDLINKYYD